MENLYLLALFELNVFLLLLRIFTVQASGQRVEESGCKWSEKTYCVGLLGVYPNKRCHYKETLFKA